MLQASSPAPEPDVTARPVPPATRRVLVVEDEQDIAELIKHSLERDTSLSVDNVDDAIEDLTAEAVAQ